MRLLKQAESSKQTKISLSLQTCGIWIVNILDTPHDNKLSYFICLLALGKHLPNPASALERGIFTETMIAGLNIYAADAKTNLCSR